MGTSADTPAVTPSRGVRVRAQVRPLHAGTTHEVTIPSTAIPTIPVPKGTAKCSVFGHCLPFHRSQDFSHQAHVYPHLLIP